MYEATPSLPNREHDDGIAAPARLNQSRGLLVVMHVMAAAALILSTLVAGQANAAEIPAELAVPGKTPALSVHAEGVQIYDCKTDAFGSMTWQFREPLATLMVSGKTVGRHFAGPTWQLSDGSSVVGRLAAQAPGKTDKDIAWLKLDVVSRQGDGALSNVNLVERLNTQGGVFKGACEQSGSLHLEPYSADYSFFNK